MPQVVVADTERALGDLARAVRAQRDAQGASRITGSNGKTSVKTLLLSILARAGTHATPTPATATTRSACRWRVLDAPEDAAVRGATRWAPASPATSPTSPRIARPDVALVNNIAPAHLERMGSAARRRRDQGRDLRRAAGGRRRGHQCRRCVRAVLRRACARPRRMLRFGLDASADVSARDLDRRRGRLAVRAAHAGRRGRGARWRCPAATTCCNALAAASLALARRRAAGRRSAPASERARAVAGRLRHASAGRWRHADRRQLQRESRVRSTPAIDDARGRAPAKRWLVLGDMARTGRRRASAARRQPARARKAAASQRLFALGALSARGGRSVRRGRDAFRRRRPR